MQNHSVDAGKRIGLSDVLGNSLYGVDGCGTEQYYEYDHVRRPITIVECKDKQRCDKERFIYGDKEKGLNVVNRLIKRYDTAGLEELASYTLQGQVLQQSRRFIDNKAGKPISWSVSLQESEALLEKACYQSTWTYNALGERLSQVDAKKCIP